MNNRISIVIITRNSEKYIHQCLTSLSNFDEVVVLDGGSSDSTVLIVNKFSNVRLHQYNYCDFIGFGALKNTAIKKTSNDWILSVDSDEIISEALSTEILTMHLNDHIVGSIERKNYYNNARMKCCGWQNDWVNRLFNKKFTQFNNNYVHESIMVKANMKIQKLKNTFNHYSYDNASQLLQKLNVYSDLWANDHRYKQQLSPLNVVLRTIFTFIRCYFLQIGFLYGYRGLIVAVTNANHVFYKYMKLYEKNKFKYL